MGGPFVEMKCSTPCDEGGSTLDSLATSGNSSRMTLPKDPGGKAMNLGRAVGWSAATAVTALAGWPLWRAGRSGCNQAERRGLDL